MDGTASQECSGSIAGEDNGKRTVLLVGHGSRVEEGNEELRAFTRLLAARRPELAFETCFIELSAPSISAGIDRCVQGGAATIYVVPIILFAAGHSKLDIPMALDEAKLKYPGVEFVYGRPIGVQMRAVDILLDRIGEAVPLNAPEFMGSLTEDMNAAGLETAAAMTEALDAGTVCAEARPSAVEDKDTIVLLMGRGGSDPDANSDFCKLTRLLWERTSYRSVEACFIAITKPLLPEGLERCLVLGARKIVVLPYLLFNGLLMQQFNETVRLFAAAHPEIEVEIGSYLGAHPLLADMLLGRIDDTLEGQAYSNCDNCKYRDEAAAHHHHHHGHSHEHSHDHGAGHHHHEGECQHGHGHDHSAGQHHHEGECHHGHSHDHGDGQHHHEGECHHGHGHEHGAGHHHHEGECHHGHGHDHSAGHHHHAEIARANARKEH
ncbi:sirohydrochlorin chelatase [Paenibacillus sp. HW567]|uniref:sirohydrochlorin chelatase n=1 Tax=Paenibacillus sp. HW567 TaxID=1034769 RepID=UPI0018DC7280